jgi:hypothetical protein
MSSATTTSDNDNDNNNNNDNNNDNVGGFGDGQTAVENSCLPQPAELGINLLCPPGMVARHSRWPARLIQQPAIRPDGRTVDR